MGSLNVTIATIPTGQLNISKDIELIKTGLLYGDKIKLYSMTSPMFLFMRMSSEILSKTEKEHIMWQIMEAFAPEVVPMKEKLNYLGKKKRRTVEESMLRILANKEIDKATKEIFGRMGDMANASGVNELLPAIERDLIEIPSKSVFGFEDSGFDDEKFIMSFMDGIVEETLSGNSYPMYDAEAANIIRLALETNLIEDIDETRMEQIKHIATVHNVLAELPNFDKASVEEIIGVREELNKYLAKFKSAMLEYSSEIKTLPWDKNFDNEISLLFMKKISPAVAELRSIVEQNSFLRKFCTNIANDKTIITPIATGVGIPLVEGLSAAILPLTNAIQLPSVLVSTSIAGGVVAAKNVINTYNSYREGKQKAEGNTLYFYYMASKKMEKRNK